MAIEWDFEKMTTGLPDIDVQHQEWLQRFNEFDHAAVTHQGMETIQSALNFFSNYTEIHFPAEEAYMAQRNCPAAAANRAAHEKFRAMISELKQWVEQEGATVVEIVALKIELEKWLVEHICTIDVQLRQS